jgi:hypothetical protein
MKNKEKFIIAILIAIGIVTYAFNFLKEIFAFNSKRETC